MTDDEVVIRMMPDHQRAVWQIANEFRKALIDIAESETLEQARAIAREAVSYDER